MFFDKGMLIHLQSHSLNLKAHNCLDVKIYLVTVKENFVLIFATSDQI